MTTATLRADAPPATLDKLPAQMTLVEIAGELEQVTGWIETQRVREREARASYQAIAQEVEVAIAKIKEYASKLLDGQAKHVTAFGGLIGREAPSAMLEAKPGRGSARKQDAKLNLADSIVAIWGNSRLHEPLTTEEIAESLAEVGYKSGAAPTSLRSSINQVLAKLCRTGRIVRFRGDGSVILPKDKTSRARKYMAATALPEGVTL